MIGIGEISPSPGQHIYMATKDTLHIFDAGTGAEVGQYNSWMADKVSVANGVAYVAARSAGLLSVDVSAPEHPRVMGAYTTTAEAGGPQPASISNMAVYGPYIYADVVASGLGLSRIDILDVSKSADIERAAISKWYMIPIRIRNGYGYYFSEYTGTQLKSIDLSDPTQPADTLGSIDTLPIPIYHSWVITLMWPVDMMESISSISPIHKIL